jgi:hypothetical protein
MYLKIYRFLCRHRRRRAAAPGWKLSPTRKNSSAFRQGNGQKTLGQTVLASVLTLAILHSTTSTALADDRNTSWQAMSLIGLQQQIPIGQDQNTSDQVALLWQRFQALQTLHYALNWSAPIEVYALYTGFNPDSAAIQLTVGYPESALLHVTDDGDWVSQAIPEGHYINVSNHHLNSLGTAPDSATPEADIQEDTMQEDTMRQGWHQLDANRLPAAVLERYRMSPEGAIGKADMLVLYR